VEHLYTFLFYMMPWWLQVLILAAIVGVPVYLIAAMLFGTRVVNRYVLFGVLFLITLGYASKLRQDGYQRRQDEERAALDHAKEVVNEERKKTGDLSDAELNAKVDKWSR
jgi:type VI protein secretion system component VasK